MIFLLVWLVVMIWGIYYIMGDFIYDEDGNFVFWFDECYEDWFLDYVDVINLFVIKGDGFDVMLFLFCGMFSWIFVSVKGREIV